MLSASEVEANARTYLEQAGRVIDVERAEIHGNAEWGATMEMGELLRLASTATVAQMLEREDFRARYQQGRPISVVEVLYPLFQGYDSVAIRADVEMGGTDQTFNLLMGREVQRAYGLAPQVVLTMPLLVGTDGERKMSKSLGNYVAITEDADQMFGKLMSIPDTLIVEYLRLCSDVGPDEADAIEAGLADGSLRPADEKRRLARSIVDLYHGPGAGAEAEARFNVVFRERGLPEDVRETRLPEVAFVDGRTILPRLLVALGLASSNSDGRRKVLEGAVRLDQEQKSDPWQEYTSGDLAGRVLQVGKRRFVRLTA